MSSLAVAWSDLWPPTVRHLVIALNVLAVIGLGVYAVYSLRGTKHDKQPENLTPFLSDDELEGPRLERAQGWALVFAGIIAVALPLYWLREPTRQDDADRTFSSQSETRGAVLYANSSMPQYNSAVSLGCASCHGTDGAGGAATSVQLVDGKKSVVSWKAPALNTVMYRFSPSEVEDILNYGRPGSPMGAWGAKGGGPKNEQSITDIVNYLISIQISPEKAQEQAAQQLEDWRDYPETTLATARETLKAKEQARDDAEAALAELQDSGDASQVAIYDAEKKLDLAEFELAKAQKAVDNAETFKSRRENVSDGQLLFELNCARCHTKGWSYWDLNQALPEEVIGLPGGNGQSGFSIRDGATLRRFTDDPDTDVPAGEGCSEEFLQYDSKSQVINPKSGCARMADFIVNGSVNNKPYGDGGMGSGRMPGQCNTALETDESIDLEHYGCMLTTEMITAIVEYEREAIDDTTAELNGAR